MESITRRGRYISVGPGITATEGHDGMPTLTIRRYGRVIHEYRGSSLVFARRLTKEDKRYLASLVSSAL